MVSWIVSSLYTNRKAKKLFFSAATPPFGAQNGCGNSNIERFGMPFHRQTGSRYRKSVGNLRRNFGTDAAPLTAQDEYGRFGKVRQGGFV